MKTSKKYSCYNGGNRLIALALLAVTAFCFTASALAAGTLLYSYDFDKVENSGLVLNDQNKGSGLGLAILKENGGGASVPYAEYGAFCSSACYYSKNANSIWIGESGGSLGCGNAKGFTVSFRVMTSASHTAGSGFFGFRLGGFNYRLEYVDATSGAFRIACDHGDGEAFSDQVTQASAGKWKHIVLVGEDSSKLKIYVDGVFVSSMAFCGVGDLEQLFIGQTMKKSGNGEYCYPDNATPNNTKIDSLDVYGFALTPEAVAGVSTCARRTIPVLWHFDEYSADAKGLHRINYGTAPYETKDTSGNNSHWTNYASTTPNDGAPSGFGNHFWFRSSAKNFYIEGDAANGLFASAGSGFTISFWLRAPGDTTDWMSILGYSLGSRKIRFAWDNSSVANLYSWTENANGSKGGVIIASNKRTVDKWQHVCAVYNSKTGKTDVYLSGSKVAEYSHYSDSKVDVIPGETEKVSMLMVGPKAPGTNASATQYSSDALGPRVDEVALFNRSLSPAQISYLGSRTASLPPLDATNLVRTISSAAYWGSDRAVWEAVDRTDEGDVFRSAVYPSLEDGMTEAAILFSDDAILTNDTIVSSRRVTFAKATEETKVSPVLKCAKGALFAPQHLEVGEGVELKISALDAKDGKLVLGGIDFGAGGKVVFDVNGIEQSVIKIPVGTITLPQGESDVRSHFALTGRTANNYPVSLTYSPISGELVLRCYPPGFRLIVR